MMVKANPDGTQLCKAGGKRGAFTIAVAAPPSFPRKWPSTEVPGEIVPGGGVMFRLPWADQESGNAPGASGPALFGDAAAALVSSRPIQRTASMSDIGSLPSI